MKTTNVNIEKGKMKSLVNKLNNLRSGIIGIEMSLGITDEDLIELDKNLIYLHVVQDELIYNLKFLRQDNVVAIIASYNQSVVQLKEVQKRIINVRNLKLKVLNKMEKLNKTKKCFECDISILESEISNSKTILLFRKIK